MKDEAFQRLLNAPLPLTLYGNRKKVIILFLCAVLFVFADVKMIVAAKTAKDNFVGWAGFVFFGLCLLVLTLKLFFPKADQLVLTKEDFKVVTFSRSYAYRWKDVSAFVVKKMKGSKFSKAVFFDEGSTGKMAHLARTLIGYSGMLPTSYGGLTIVQLATLMNHRRERALKQNA